MEKRVRSAVCLVIVGLVTSVSAGCMSPPAIWRPPADGARFKPSGNALVVMPVEDTGRPRPTRCSNGYCRTRGRARAGC